MPKGTLFLLTPTSRQSHCAVVVEARIDRSVTVRTRIRNSSLPNELRPSSFGRTERTRSVLQVAAGRKPSDLCDSRITGRLASLRYQSLRPPIGRSASLGTTHHRAFSTSRRGPQRTIVPRRSRATKADSLVPVSDDLSTRFPQRLAVGNCHKLVTPFKLTIHGAQRLCAAADQGNVVPASFAGGAVPARLTRNEGIITWNKERRKPRPPTQPRLLT